MQAAEVHLHKVDEIYAKAEFCQKLTHIFLTGTESFSDCQQSSLVKLMAFCVQQAATDEQNLESPLHFGHCEPISAIFCRIFMFIVSGNI